MNVMKEIKNVKPVSGYTSKPLKGRAAFIAKLQRRGVSPKEALVRSQRKFDVSAGAFTKIWKAHQHANN